MEETIVYTTDPEVLTKLDNVIDRLDSVLSVLASIVTVVSDILIYVKVNLWLIGIIVCFVFAFWFVKTYVVRLLRRYYKFNI